MERLTTIQIGLRVTKDKSGDKGRFKFRSAEDIFEKLKPLLEETKTAVVVSDELVEIGGVLAIKATARLCASSSVEIASAAGYAIYDKHEIIKKDTGEVISTMSNEQCTGSASSYARKYALCGLFAIDNDENDPDQPDIKKADTEQHKQQQKPAPMHAASQTMQLTDEQKELYTSLLADLDAADKTASVIAIATMADKQPFELAVRKKAARKGIELATSAKELNDAYLLIKDRDGWQEFKNFAIKTAAEKKLK